MELGAAIIRGLCVAPSEPTSCRADKLSTFTEHWQPRTVGAFNGHDLMVVKVTGAFVWHTHDDTDDFFLVLKGRMTRLGRIRACRPSTTTAG